MENQSKNDLIRYYEFEIKQLNDENFPLNRNEKMMFLNIRDITEMIKSLERLKDQVYYDAIENNFSHELMTPLNPITNCSYLLKQGILKIHAKNNQMVEDSRTLVESYDKESLSHIVKDRDLTSLLKNSISVDQAS